jgi:hypothetical protein
MVYDILEFEEGEKTMEKREGVESIISGLFE